MIVLWAARLGSFLFRRVNRDGGDGRFDQIKLDGLRFSMAWMLQALWVTLTAGAALAAMTSGAKADLGPVGIIGLVVWLIGFAIEVTADRRNRPAPIRLTEVGSLTSGCGRGVATRTTSARSPSGSGSPSWRRPSCGWQYATLISPVFVFVLLNFVSGVPMLERRSDREWGGQEAYEAFKAKTPF